LLLDKKYYSIKVKIIFALVSSAFIALLLSFVTLSTYTLQQDKSRSIHSLQEISKIIAYNLPASITFHDTESATSLLQSLNLDTNIEVAFILDAKKQIFASYSLKNDVSKKMLQTLIKKYKQKNVQKSIATLDDSCILIGTPVYVETEYIATLFIASNTDEFYDNLLQQFIVLLIVFVLTILFILLLALKVQKVFTTPITQLNNAMQTIVDTNKYDTTLYTNRKDEFRTLFASFNIMIERINETNAELQKQKNFVQTLLDSQEQLIITTNGEKLISANKTFLEFFAVDNVTEFMHSYEANCICDTFNTEAPEEYLQIKMGRESWIDYVISCSFDVTHKAMISMGSIDFIFSVTATKLPGDEGIKSAVFTNITDMENAKLEIESINKHTKESIEYAALIQSALIPDNNVIRKYFQDQFVIWHPKDTVGGDIYLFEELRHDGECLLMVIDCTGHGVPGAFVTMLVKAIERQVTAKINHNKDEIVSPAKILSVFNKNMKQLLKQENKSSISNAGFDGQVLYYNKKDKIIKFASAKNELFYYKNDEIQVIKGNKHSVGYRDSDANYEFTEHTLAVEKGLTLYLTTDGYIDQNGGKKGFPFGKKRFKKMLEEIHNEKMADQQEEFIYTLAEYQNGHETNDDITVIGLKI